MEHLPKINISLGTLVIICFFLPWVSVDCGSTTIAKFSGYDLTAGKISIDANAARQAAQSGKIDRDYTSGENGPYARPQLYYLTVIICALGVIGYGYKMLSERDKVTTFAVVVFALLGAMIMLYSSLRNFGMEIPNDAAVFIKVSNDFAFYLASASFLGSAVVSFVGLREFFDRAEKKIPANMGVPVTELPVQLLEQLPPEAESNLLPRSDFAEFENLPAEKPLQPAPSPAPGTKLCPSCGVKVSVYQSKCIKCGTKLKPGK